jgi:hypothetical protein
MPRPLRHLPILLLTALSLSCSSFAQHKLNFRAHGTEFDVTVPDNELAVSDADLQAYIERGANAIVEYFGSFPMKHVNIRIRAVNGQRVRFGRTMPEDGGTIMMMIGRDAHADALTDDWTLTHEMSHLSFPATKGDDHDWLQEGMATYVEPIARAQLGYLTPEYVWRQFVKNMSKGEPAPGDRGIDNTPTWGRTYWGGALFCLVADIQIHEQTHNRKGLQDAFRSIMRKDGTMEWVWDINTIFETGDRATGTHVLEKLYRDWKDKPIEVDLDKIWRELGIEKQGEDVIFNDKAPLSSVRRAILQRR